MGYKFTLELPVFFATFGFMLTVSVNSNLLMYRTCYVLLHQNKTECAQLGFINNNETEYLEKLVEPTATYIALVKTIFESTFGSVLCLFIAPWSDRFGRKPVLILGFAGGVVAMLLNVVFAAVDTLTPWFVLVIPIPALVTGGGASFVTIIFAYISDCTTKGQRAFKMGIFDCLMVLALLLGNASSSYVLIATNYIVVYCIAAACSLVALIYTILLLPESLQQRETENPVAEFFKISNFVEMIKTPFKPRENSNRTLLMLIMVTMLLGFLSGGSMDMFFYFLREKLHWTLIQFTWYSTITSVLGIFSSMFAIYLLHTMLKIQETILIFIGSIFSVASVIVIGFAVKDWQIYLGAILNLPAAGSGTLTKALITKLVHEEEVAKIMSAFSIGSSILGPLSSAGYTALYNATINTDPGFFNFVTAAIFTCSSIVFMFVLIVQRNNPTAYTTLENEQNERSEPENLIASDVNEDVLVR